MLVGDEITPQDSDRGPARIGYNQVTVSSWCQVCRFGIKDDRVLLDANDRQCDAGPSAADCCALEQSRGSAVEARSIDGHADRVEEWDSGWGNPGDRQVPRQNSYRLG